MFDIMIIGAGPGGYVAAIRGAQLGAKVVIFEKDNYGGTCLNRGCIPMKSLLHNAKEHKDFLDTLKKYGCDYNSQFDFEKDADVKRSQTVKQLTGGVKGLLKKNGVKCVEETAEVISKGKVRTSSGEIYEGKNIIIATGTEVGPTRFEVRDNSKLWISDTIFRKLIIPKKLTIVGGGVIGVEVAQCFRNFGTEVTILEFQDRILPMFSKTVSETLTAKFKALKIAVECGCNVKLIDKGSVSYLQNGEEKVINSDYVFVAIGRTPNVNNETMKKLGIETERGFIKTDSKMRTTQDGIYAIGDINGKSMLAHTASVEGIVAVENIMGIEREMNYDSIPQCVYTDLEIGCCGKTEEQLIKDKIKYHKSMFPLIANGKALIEGETNGYVEMIASDEYNELLGVSIVSPKATELINICSVAMQGEITADELKNYIFAHPTLSETIGEAAKGLAGKAIHV